MLGPIDYIVVGFEGNKFDGSVMSALADAIDKEIIRLVTLALVSKDESGNVTKLKLDDTGNNDLAVFVEKYAANTQEADQVDIDEVADLIENNCTAGLLVVEQLWAKPLKAALIKANGVLVAEGRIHPEAAVELEKGDQ